MARGWRAFDLFDKCFTVTVCITVPALFFGLLAVLVWSVIAVTQHERAATRAREICAARGEWMQFYRGEFVCEARPGKWRVPNE